MEYRFTSSVLYIPVYVHAPQEETPWQTGAASRWWLHHSLAALDESLRERGSGLVIAAGENLPQLRRIARACGATQVFWNRLYDPAAVARDGGIKQALRGDGLGCESFNAGLLFEPWEIVTGNLEPYRVFSAFWHKASSQLPAGDAQPAPNALSPLPAGLEPLPLDALGLLPRIPWDAGLAEAWRPGEVRAAEQAQRFLAGAVAGYATGRDLPAQPRTSRLSPHLHFGEIGPRQLVGLAARMIESVSEPWTAPTAVLAQARLALGSDYARPPVDPGDSRKQALAAWERVKG